MGELIDSTLKDLLIGLGLDAALAAGILKLTAGAVLAGLVGAVGIPLIYAERKLLARLQDRLGPNRVGPNGMLQTIADPIKLLTKEMLIPEGADRWVFRIAPLLVFASTIAIWAVMPMAPDMVGADVNVALLYIVAIGAVGTLGIMMAGLSSNNKYALLGAFRTVAQMVSYAVPLLLALLVPTLLAGSMGMVDIVEAQDPVWFLFLAPIAALIFFVSSIAEIGRSPFDLQEAESEIVAGFHIEYSGMAFGMFMAGEFLHALTISALFAVIFLGGWNGPAAADAPFLGFIYFAVKTILVYLVVVWIRGTVPRIRIDQMNALNWKLITPLALVVLMVTAVVDKAALEADLPRLLSHLIANLVVLLLAAWLIRRHAAALRKRLERAERPQVTRPEPASG